MPFDRPVQEADPWLLADEVLQRLREVRARILAGSEQLAVGPDGA